MNHLSVVLCDLFLSLYAARCFNKDDDFPFSWFEQLSFLLTLGGKVKEAVLSLYQLYQSRKVMLIYLTF